MNSNWMLLIAVLVSAFVMVSGQKIVERYLGRKSDPVNKIFSAGVRVAAIVLLFVVPMELWPDNPIPLLWPFLALVIGDLASQCLLGKRVLTSE